MREQEDGSRALGTLPGGLIIKLALAPRLWILVGMLALGLICAFAVAPIPQAPGYHRFADARTFLGIPNFNDVMSNVGFLLIGVAGVLVLTGKRSRRIFFEPRDARPYVVFFLAVSLVAFGSGYYHWAPSNERLLWDRLPMSVAFMAFASAIVADRIDARAGNGWVLVLLIALGIASLIYWDWTESLGRGDLRFYGLVQFYPMIALPVICWLFPEHRYTANRYLFWVIMWYGLSKLFEHFDGHVFDIMGQSFSGHTLKHLAAAIAPLVVLRMLLSGNQTQGTNSLRR